MLLRDLSQGSKFSDASIGEKDIDSPLRADGLVETIQVGEFGNVSLNAGNAAADCFRGIGEFFLATARDEDIGTLPDEELCRGHPYSRSAAGDACDFSFQLGHGH